MPSRAATRLFATPLFAIALAAALLASAAKTQAAETAIFAGGCFWCVEKDFEHVPGVISAVPGYTGGITTNPTYKNHTAAGHLEAVKIDYDPAVVSYGQLLDVFWRSVDPTDDGGQFCDRGSSYTTAIFVLGDQQLALAIASKADLAANNQLGKPIVTPVRAADTFYPAEDYHQNYYKKSPTRYTYYRFTCGRDAKIRKLWGNEAHAGIVK